MTLNRTEVKDIKKFFKFAIFVPVLLTIFLQWLQFAGKLNLPWYWVFSPIWIWIGGAFQFLIGGIITEFFEGKK